MPDKGVSQISNSFSTGGGGVNFEQNIQAMFLLSLILDGFCPALSEKTKKVCFQAKHLGYAVDDLVVITERKNGEGKLLCQMKHKITVSASNSTFKEVIAAAWKDFNDVNFDKKKDKIALVLAEITVSSQQSLRFLNAQATVSQTEQEFLDRIYRTSFSNENNKKVFEAIKTCIFVANGKEPDSIEMWDFCRSFLILLFDLDCKESVNRVLATTLIKTKSIYEPALVWSRLVTYAAECNQSAATIDLNNIDVDILDYFRTETKVTYYPPQESDDSLTIESGINQAVGHQKEMPILALIGAWREENENDRSIIERIAGQSYAEFVQKTRSFLPVIPQIVTLKNGRWKIEKREEVLERCLPFIFDDDIERLFASAKEVFSQKSIRVNGSETIFIDSAYEYDNSIELRENLLTSICWLKKYRSKLVHVTQTKLDGKIFSFVDKLLNKCDWETWVSLRDSLQKLAELSPQAFLEKIELSVVHNPEEITKLFPRRGEGDLLHPNYSTSLLWAIEILAWNPEYISQAIGTLGLLETLQYENTNWTNTPINSIISILLPWYPQTLADFEKRKNALLCLKKDNEDIFWKVLVRLLPGQTSSTTDNPRPRFMNIEMPEKIAISNKEIVEQSYYYLELAINHSEGYIERTAFLASMLRYMDAPLLEKYIEIVEGISNIASEEELVSIWIKLKDSISEIKDAFRATHEEYFKRIQSIIAKIEPNSIWLKYQELYLGEAMYDEGTDAVKAWEKEELDKIKAVKEIYEKYGAAQTEHFGKAVENVSDVSDKLGISLFPEGINAIISAYEDGDISKEFAVTCIRAFVRKNGPKQLLETNLISAKSQTRLDILTGITYVAGLNEVVEKALPVDSLYWESAPAPLFFDDNEGEFKFLIGKLVKNQRFAAAINLIGHADYDKVFDTNYIINLLKKAGTEEPKGKETLDRYIVQRLFSWIEKQPDISLNELSDLELLYLPVLMGYDEKIPLALKTRIGTDPIFFCEMIELMFKKRNEEKGKGRRASKQLAERIFSILFNFSVVPGIGMDGTFSAEKFKEWFSYVKEWSKENDRYEVTMHKVGAGLAYSHDSDSKLPPRAIMEELNKAESNDLRQGYRIGISNKRGFHFVDPEGKPEFELAQDFKDRATQAEKLGYSRYSQTLLEIAEKFEREGRDNIERSKQDNESD